jgi:hypothetical protein
MLKQDKYRQFLFLLTALEGLAAMLITASIPGERNGNLPGGFTPQRLAILLAIAILSVIFFLLSANNRKITKFRNSLFESLQGFSAAQAIATLFLVFFTFCPPLTLITDYQAIFHRLYFLLAWVTIANLQLMVFPWVMTILDKGLDAFLQRGLNTLKPIIPWAVCIIFPILFLTPRLWEFGDHIYTVGNDFVPLYAYKVYLLDFLVHFRLPLWSPSESVGFPFLASPLTQTLYPLNIPLAVFYWWKGSYGLLDHTWFAAFGISIFCGGMYAWLRQFRWKDTYALMAAMVISISFPLPELLRFTFAIHNFAWLPWILFFLTDIFKIPANRKPWHYYLGLGFVLFSFVTASYTYYVFYSIFLLVPYIAILLMNPARKFIGFPRWKFDIRPLLAIFATGLIVAAFLSPYLMNIGVTLFQVSARGIRDFNYSTEHVFSWIDILGSLVYPPVASAEGWFFIGFIPLSLLLNYFISVSKSREKNVADQWYRSIPVKLGLGFLIAFYLSLAIGKDSIIFRFFWDHMPFFYSFRNWGRFCIMLLPLFGFGLAASLEVFFTQLKDLGENFTMKKLSINLAKWTGIYLAFFLAQTYARTFNLNGTWSASFYNLNDRIWLFQVSLIASWIAMLSIFLISIKSRRTWFVPYVLIAVTFFDLFPVGAFQWLIDTYPEENPPGRLNLIGYVIPSSFNYPRTFGKSNISLTTSYSMGPYPTWYYARYWEFFFKYSNEERIFESFLGKDNKGLRVFLTSAIDYKTIAEFMSDASGFSGSYHVDSYDGENLQLEIESSQDGYVSFIDNWDPFWTVTVNGKSAPIEKLYDTFKSTKIPAGKSIVRFEYKPELFPIKQFMSLISN